jgi:hypothetical protein
MTCNERFPHISYGRLALLSLVLLLIPLSESTAQTEWRKTVKVIVPVEEGSIMRALTDSVMAMAEANQLPIRRAPAADTTTLSDVEDALAEEGLALTSATHAFITYRFKLDDGSLRRDILNLHFIYRPTAQQGEDIPVLYVDLTKDDLYQEVLVEKGTPSPINEVVYHPFGEQIRLRKIQDKATVVQVGNRIIRDAEQAAAEKQNILRTIRRLTYS